MENAPCSWQKYPKTVPNRDTRPHLALIREYPHPHSQWPSLGIMNHEWFILVKHSVWRPSIGKIAIWLATQAHIIDRLKALNSALRFTRIVAKYKPFFLVTWNMSGAPAREAFQHASTGLILTSWAFPLNYMYSWLISVMFCYDRRSC